MKCDMKREKMSDLSITKVFQEWPKKHQDTEYFIIEGKSVTFLFKIKKSNDYGSVKVFAAASKGSESSTLPFPFWALITTQINEQKYEHFHIFDQNKSNKLVFFTSIKDSLIPEKDVSVTFSVHLVPAYRCSLIRDRGDNTCYLNSSLQLLFHIAKFRRLLFSIRHGNDPRKKVILNLQTLFKVMCTCKSSTSTVALTESFGWPEEARNIQHDAAEFLHVLLEYIEKKLENEEQVRTFNEMFKTITVNNENNQTQSFVIMNLKAKPNLMDSIAKEMKNKKFSKLPEVLFMSIDRYDSSKVVYPEILDLSKYVMADIEPQKHNEAQKEEENENKNDNINENINKNENKNENINENINENENINQNINENKNDLTKSQDGTYTLAGFVVRNGCTIERGHYVSNIRLANCKFWGHFNDQMTTFYTWCFSPIHGVEHKFYTTNLHESYGGGSTQARILMYVSNEHLTETFEYTHVKSPPTRTPSKREIHLESFTRDIEISTDQDVVDYLSNGHYDFKNVKSSCQFTLCSRDSYLDVYDKFSKLSNMSISSFIFRTSAKNGAPSGTILCKDSDKLLSNFNIQKIHLYFETLDTGIKSKEHQYMTSTPYYFIVFNSKNPKRSKFKYLCKLNLYNNSTFSSIIPMLTEKLGKPDGTEIALFVAKFEDDRVTEYMELDLTRKIFYYLGNLIEGNLIYVQEKEDFNSIDLKNYDGLKYSYFKYLEKLNGTPTNPTILSNIILVNTYSIPIKFINMIDQQKSITINIPYTSCLTVSRLKEIVCIAFNLEYQQNALMQLFFGFRPSCPLSGPIKDNCLFKDVFYFSPKINVQIYFIIFQNVALNESISVRVCLSENAITNSSVLQIIVPKSAKIYDVVNNFNCFVDYQVIQIINGKISAVAKLEQSLRSNIELRIEKIQKYNHKVIGCIPVSYGAVFSDTFFVYTFGDPFYFPIFENGSEEISTLAERLKTMIIGCGAGETYKLKVINFKGIIQKDLEITDSNFSDFMEILKNDFIIAVCIDSINARDVIDQKDLFKSSIKILN